MKSKRKNLVEKIINFLLNVLIFIFGIILLISIYIGIQTKILGNKYADFFGYSIFEVETGSMADTINAGDCIIVKHAQKIKLNDIVTYEKKGEYITHRVIEVYKGTYITKGDANNAKDEPIDQKQILGKVVSIWAGFGIFRRTLFNPVVLIALIVTLFLFNLAFKKNKTAKFSKSENNNWFYDVVIKRVCSFFILIIKKIKLLIVKIIQFIKNKMTKKEAPTNNLPKAEINNTERKVPLINKIDATITNEEVEEHYKDEDELDKTSFYRVIPVDANEVGDKYKNAPTKEEVEDYYKDEDELDKTSLYRMIPVDASEVNDTFLEIAKNEMKDAGQTDKSKEKVEASEPKAEEQAEVPAEENLTNINLDLLKEIKKRKSKNIIDTVIIIKEEELNELINILVKDDKTYVNKETIKDTFITTYIDAKYYNYYGSKDAEHLGKNAISKIEKAIKEIALASELQHGNDDKYHDIVDKYADLFVLIASLEQARDSIDDSKAKHEFFKKEIKKHFNDWNSQAIEKVIDEIITIQKSYLDTLAYFLKKLDTNMFILNFNELSTKKDMYCLDLQHNITFSKVYSDYIIDKTYKEGIIAEDKMSVLLTLLSVQLIKDMTSFNFNKKYLLYIPESLYKKEKKLEKLLRMIDDKYAKSNVVILINFEDLSNNEKMVKEVRKMGYKFALILDNASLINENNRGNMFIANYLFINKKAADKSKILSFVPAELLDHVIYEDIAEKVGDLGDEQE